MCRVVGRLREQTREWKAPGMSNRKILLQSLGPKGQGEEQSYRSPVGTTTVEKRPSSRSCIIEKYSYCAEAKSWEEMLTSFFSALPPPGGAIHLPDPTRSY